MTLVDYASGTDTTITYNLINPHEGSTVGGDKLYDQTGFVEGCRSRGITPHVAVHYKERNGVQTQQQLLVDGCRLCLGCLAVLGLPSST